MINCYVNGTEVYPKLTDKIKITKENVFIKERDSYTYEITFPMNIIANRSIFGNVQRLDVKKGTAVYKNCMLYADNILVIGGVGTVTSVTNKEVKLQIVSGKGALKYKESFYEKYIDRLPLGRAEWDSDWLLHENVCIGNMNVLVQDGARYQFGETRQWRRQGYLGYKDEYVLMPVYDAVNGCYCNVQGKIRDDDTTDIVMYPRAQPNLFFIFRKIMNCLGFSADCGLMDKEPWNRLYIANARDTQLYNEMLPHWTVKTFLEEFSKLFNVSYKFDERQDKITVMPYNETLSDSTADYEPFDEFSMDYDEDGLNYIGASNIEYNIDNGDYRKGEVITQDMYDSFGVREYDSGVAMREAYRGLSDKEKYTSIFHCPDGFYYARKTDLGPFLTRFGRFTGIVRNKESADPVRLLMCPVQYSRDEKIESFLYYRGEGTGGGRMNYKAVFTAGIAVASENTDIDLSDEYVSVADVVDEGAEAPSRDSESSDNMYLMFANFSAKDSLGSSEMERLRPIPEDGNGYVPVKSMAIDYNHAYPDSELANLYSKESLALTSSPATCFIGQFHQAGDKNDFCKAIENQNKVVIKFLADNIPEPTKTYIFHNKRFMCEKIEITVGSEGVDKLKTGYFYEII